MKNKLLVKMWRQLNIFKGQWKWLPIIGMLLLISLLLLPPGNRLSKMQIRQRQSEIQLKGVGQLVLAYQSRHGGNMPRKLSDVVPEDRTDLLSTFYIPHALNSAKPKGWSTNRMILDELSDYVAASNTNSGVLAFEKPGLWPDGTVAVCFMDLSVERISTAAFKALTMPAGTQTQP